MSERSGIEMLSEILDRMSVLDRRMEVIEQNMRLILSQRNAIPAPNKEPLRISVNGKAPQLAESSSQAVPGGLRFNGKQPIDKPQPKIQPAPNARVESKIKDSEGKPLPEVQVTIYDAKNNIVKRTRTNRAGLWMAFLPPGKYGAECLLEGKVNENLVFSVKPGQEIVEVSPSS